MLAAVVFSNNIWTFWDVMFLFFFWIPAIMLYIYCFFDIFGRHDISGGAKAAWVILLLLLPWIGALAYLIARPADASYPAAA